MPPNQDEAILDVDVTEPTLQLTPFIETPASSEASFSLSTDSEHSINFYPGILLLFGNVRIPPEQNLRELLLKVTDTNDLQNVTQVKLRVIARDVSLQHLNIHTPILKELILDGSVITSLRDLGCKLNCLKILKVNRCGLTSLDGLFGLETLEELYAGHNYIEDVSSCSHLPGIKIIDVKNNKLNKLTSISFLNLCESLEHLVLSGNDAITNKPDYREIVKKWLPKLVTLDGISFNNKLEPSPTRKDLYRSDTDDDDENENSIKPENISHEKQNISSTITSSLPPINSKLMKTNRPATTSKCLRQTGTDLSTKYGPLRPSTSGGTTIIPLPNILTETKKPSAPSCLTSGEPICGNIAASLRNRIKLQEAWIEKK